MIVNKMNLSPENSRTARRPFTASYLALGRYGLPNPRQQYIQELVPGMLIVLWADGKLNRYHGSADSNPKYYCPSSQAETPARFRSDISVMRTNCRRDAMTESTHRK